MQLHSDVWATVRDTETYKGKMHYVADGQRLCLLLNESVIWGRCLHKSSTKDPMNLGLLEIFTI